MATSFPGSLDSLTNPTSSDKLNSGSVPHAGQHSDLNDAMEAVQARIGATGSAVTSSITYFIDNTAVTLTGDQTLTNKTLKSPNEFWTVSATAATGTVNVDVITSGAWYYTSNASANWTFNFRGDGSTTLDSILAVAESVTVVFAVTQGATPRYASAFQVDGSSVTPKWSGGSAPSSGNASSVDIYTFTILKTASATFTVFASQTEFG